MKIAVFIGPTAPLERCRRELPEATYLPPAARGDVFRAERAGADIIVLIDGYFDHQLSVLHKELLWALSRGCAVYGASSMGALRAAELRRFGMIGVGKIFESYRDGALEDDDEVVLVHESAERGYKLRSDPLVNIRFTLQSACERAVIQSSTATAVLAAAKAEFFATRTFSSAIATCIGNHADLQDELSRLRSWLERAGSYVDQKREDAVAVLRRVAADSERLGDTRRSAPPDFRFEYTEAWHELVREIARAPMT